jgi:DNA-binding SARP family transcriptional activator
MELHLLEVRLLGNYDVRLNGAPVEINSRPARLLLAYLVLMAGTPQPRDKVAGILWPDSDETSARGNLRQALWRLRKSIGPGCLSVDNTTVAFEDSPECWLDTASLEDPADGDLVATLSAYKGELLPGYYENWVLLERERLWAAFERKSQRLLALLRRQQAWSDLLHWAENWIAFGQAPEPAYRALMIANAAQGDLPAVASAYERCVSALQLEVGVDPSEKTRTLYDR